jgi:hypothetical protein
LLLVASSRADGPSSAPDASTAPLSVTTEAALPLETQYESVPRRGLLIAGSITFGTGYLFSLMAARGDRSEPARKWLYLPIAGPFLFLSKQDTSCPGQDPPGCVNDDLTGPFFMMFGLAQVTGAILFASGYAFPRLEPVGNGAAQRPPRDPAMVTWTVSPAWVGGSGLGLSASGSLF